MVERSVIAKLEGTFASGSPEKQLEVLRHVTDLFMIGAKGYSDEQIDLFDGVISRLADRIEVRARAELAVRLAPVENAPPETIRKLARDAAIEVAEPVLRHSPRLSEQDLIALAADERHDSQDRLLAISKRSSLSENVSDVLVTRGNREVILSVARNEGARLSDNGYGALVSRSIDDDVLAACVGSRKDIPREHFQTLISKASRVVFDKLVAANPAMAREVQSVLTGITGQQVPPAPEPGGGNLDTLRRSGRTPDEALLELATAGCREETVAALAVLCRAPRELVEGVMADRRGDNDFLLLLARAAGLSWQTTREICILRRGPTGMSQQDIDAARRSFEKLRGDTAQRVVAFYNERHTAFANFQRLAERIDEKETTPRFARPAQAP
ncbi:MAG TPA: DUF2336 domain-containing protein [Pseudolabrys sp.]|nr:DUF2336 domain-containing protein [Pseudolabrys sp.]